MARFPSALLVLAALASPGCGASVEAHEELVIIGQRVRVERNSRIFATKVGV